MRRIKGVSFEKLGLIRTFKQSFKGIENPGTLKYYHIAPKKYGFYAFPEGIFDWYYIINRNPYHDSQKSFWLKDSEGNKIPYQDDEYNGFAFENLSKDVQKLIQKKKIRKRQVSYGYSSLCTENGRAVDDSMKYLIYYRKIRKFQHKGFVWSHLHTRDGFPQELKDRGVIVRSWIRLSWEDYCLAFHKTVLAVKKKLWGDDNDFRNGNIHWYRHFMKREWVNSISGATFEVFIEKWEP